MSGLSLMRVGLLPDVSDGVFQPFAKLAPFTLTGADGLKTVYAQ